MRIFDVAATSVRLEGRAASRLSTWTKAYLQDAAIADLGCALVGVFMAAQLRVGRKLTPMYLAHSLALPVLGIAVLLLVGAYADHVCRRLVVKPRPTGPWRLSGQTFPERVDAARPAIRGELIGRAGPANLMEPVSVLLRGSEAYQGWRRSGKTP